MNRTRRKLKKRQTQALKNLGSKDYGKQMVQRAVEFAREKEIKILPLYPFAKAEFDKNESTKDVLF